MKTKLLLTLTILILPAMLLGQVQVNSSLEHFTKIMQMIESRNVEAPVSLLHVIEILREFKVNPDLKNRKLFKTENEWVSETVQQDWSAGTWTNKVKDIITFTADQLHLISLVSQTWDGSGWVYDSRMTMPLDNGLVSEMRLETWYNNAWTDEMLTTYTYDGSGNLTVIVMQMANAPGSPLENFIRTVDTYTGGKLTQSQNYMWDETSSTWTLYSVSDYTYNNQSQLIEKVNSIDILGAAMITDRVLYTYHASGLDHTSTSQDYVMGTQSWTNTKKTLTEWNGQGQRIEEIDQTWNGAAWDHVDRYTITYNSNDNVIESLFQTWNGSAWVNDEHNLYIYNSDNNETEDLSQIWDGAQWVDVDRYTTVYNGSDLPESMTYQTKSGETWENDTRWLYNYEATAIEDIHAGIPGSFSLLQNYPNPFNPETAVSYQLSAAGYVTLTVYDLLGREIVVLVNGQRLAGEYKVTWNASGFPSGIYLYRLQTGTSEQIRKMVLTK